MTFVQATKTCFQKYFTFSGRAPRSEFWYFVLFFALVNSLGTLFQSFGVTEDSNKMAFTFGIYFGLGSGQTWWTNIVSGLFIIPFMSAATRRLNDTNFPVGKLVAAVTAGLIILSFASKITDDQLPVLAVLGPSLIVLVAFIYVLARKSFAGTNIHGPNPHEPAIINAD